MFASLLGVLVAQERPAQSPQQVKQEQEPQTAQQVQELKALRKAKLARPVFAAAPWRTDYDKALAEAKQANKPLLVYFTRSFTACPNSDAFEAGPLKEPGFAAFAANVVLYVHVTSRLDDDPQPTLMQSMGFRVWPALCFLDAQGKVLGKPARTLDAMRSMAGERQALLDLRGKGDARSAAEQKQWFFAEMKFGGFLAADVPAHAAKLTFDAAETAWIAQRVIDLEVEELFAQFAELGRDKASSRMVEMVRAGRLPTGEMAGAFWLQVLEWASREHDAKLGQQAFDQLLARYAKESGPGLTRQRARWQKLLDEAKTKPPQKK